MVEKARRKVQTRSMQWTVAIIIALTVSMAFLMLTQAQAPFTQRFKIWQSHGVSASGTVTFTKDGVPLRSFTVHCPGGYGDYNYYEFDLPEKPNDISWDITINWSGACGNPGHNAEQWTGANQPWPRTYRRTHSHSPEEWEVSFGETLPPVGYNIPWLIITVVSLMLAGGYLIFRFRKRGKLA